MNKGEVLRNCWELLEERLSIALHGTDGGCVERGEILAMPYVDLVQLVDDIAQDWPTEQLPVDQHGVIMLPRRIASALKEYAETTPTP